MNTGISPSKWGKCHVCGRNAVVGVSLNFCRLKADGSIYEPSYRTMMHPDHPFLCEEHRHILAMFAHYTFVPSPPDARGNVRTRYPFSREGWYVVVWDTPHAVPPGVAASTTTQSSPPRECKTRSLWPAAAKVQLPGSNAAST
ncbi:hypothetical protein [Humisphaera borealis]|uniref:Uncharacterized protein n=1 Tax=Humisphaera borealis TaxID=2807512 RepID=A0A7M2X0L8_9BACT|nr:hypothetical protein [Humisphaera borealis]QOV90962.1 hypothetical protein IPV69_06265 [Humisphaera borealis]